MCYCYLWNLERNGWCETIRSTAAPQTTTRLGVVLGRDRCDGEEQMLKQEGTVCGITNKNACCG